MRRSSDSTSSRSRSRNVSRSGSSRSCEDVGDERAQRALRDRSAAQAGDDVVDGHRQAGEREADVLADDSPDADRERLLDHDHPSRSRKRLPDLFERIGPEAPDAEGGDVDVLGS